jgi:hypothetical protein
VLRESLDLWPAFQLYFPIHDKLAGPRFYARLLREVACGRLTGQRGVP